MAKHSESLFVLAIVGIVAVVGIVFMVSATPAQMSLPTENVVGQAATLDCVGGTSFSSYTVETDTGSYVYTWENGDCSGIPYSLQFCSTQYTFPGESGCLNEKF